MRLRVSSYVLSAAIHPTKPRLLYQSFKFL